MITLNNDQGLVQIENWQDVESLPGFVKDLDPGLHKLDSILGRYALRDRVRCGLSNCRTPHGKGYVVKTKDGTLTNIGKDCGKLYFGVDFEELSVRFDRDMTMKERRERLLSFSLQADELQARVSVLRKGPVGADWVHAKTRPLITSKSDHFGTVVRRLEVMIRNRSNKLVEPRLATQKEAELMQATQPNFRPPFYIDDEIAEIAGIAALYSENDLRKLLVLDIEENLKEFEKQDIGSLSFDQLRHWAKWVEATDLTMERAEQAVKYGQQLLTVQNLTPFLKILDEAETRLFRRYLKDLPTALS